MLAPGDWQPEFFARKYPEDLASCRNSVDNPFEFTYPGKEWNFLVTYEGNPWSYEKWVVSLNGLRIQDLPRTASYMKFRQGIFKSTHDILNDGILLREVFLLKIDGLKVPIELMHNKRNQLLQIDAENKPIKVFQGVKLDSTGIAKLKNGSLPYLFSCKDKKISVDIDADEERFVLQIEGKDFDVYQYCDPSFSKQNFNHYKS